MQTSTHLINATKKQQVLRDRVTGLVKGLHTGILVFGRGGTGKSHIVENQLLTLKASRQKLNSHITPLALYKQLERFHDEIILLEDCESLLRSTIALGILRSATFPSEKDRNGNPIRVVDYHHGDQAEQFTFNGRIIMLMNRGLGSTPEAEALATRIETIEYDLSNAEICALMKDQAAKGYTIGQSKLSPEECSEVVEFLIEGSRKAGRQMNLRMMEAAFKDYLLNSNLDSGCTWKDLVASKIQGQPNVIDAISPAVARAAEKHRELEFARSVADLGREERNSRWFEETGKSPATLYRRLSKVGNIDSEMFEV